MTRQSYQDDLDTLRADVLAMGDLVVEQLDDGLAALRTGDAELAREVIDRDTEVNETYLAIERQCIDLFALQQPVAGDLRFVAASFKIITDLERIADLATNLGGYALAAEATVAPSVATDDIGDAVRSMVVRSLDAYADRDADACREIDADDDRIDAMCEEASEAVARELIGRDAAAGSALDSLVDDVSRLLLTVRDLERVADHAVNIAARTLYMVDNDPDLVY
jgi:phosphate transport system protein